MRLNLQRLAHNASFIWIIGTYTLLFFNFVYIILGFLASWILKNFGWKQVVLDWPRWEVLLGVGAVIFLSMLGILFSADNYALQNIGPWEKKFKVAGVFLVSLISFVLIFILTYALFVNYIIFLKDRFWV